MGFKKFAKRSKPRGRKASAKCKVSSCVKKYVQKAIAVQTENKMANIASVKLFNTNFGLWDNISPQISNNTSVSGRIGNQVRLKSVILRYVMGLNPIVVPPYTPYVYGQFNLRLVMGHLATSPYQIPTAGDNLKLLRQGNTPLAPDSSLITLIRPVNKYWWKIGFDKKFKIGTNNQSSPPFTNNNDYGTNRMGSINITKLYKKSLKFEDATVFATNCGVYLNGMLTDITGTPTAYATAPINFTYEIDYVFEDA